MVVSQDVVFDEEGQWDFETHEKEYNFFPPLGEEKTPQHVQQELTHQHQPLTKTLCHLLRVKGLCHAQEPSKIFMIKLRDWIISHYFVSLQIVNQRTLKKLWKIKDGEM